MSRVINPWEDIPANDNTRGGFHAGPGGYQGHGVKNPTGVARKLSNLRPPKDKTSGFKKGIRLA